MSEFHQKIQDMISSGLFMNVIINGWSALFYVILPLDYKILCLPLGLTVGLLFLLCLIKGIAFFQLIPNQKDSEGEASPPKLDSTDFWEDIDELELQPLQKDKLLKLITNETNKPLSD